MRIISTLTIGLALTLAACGGDDSTGDDTNAETGTQPTSTSGTPGTDTSGTPGTDTSGTPGTDTSGTPGTDTSGTPGTDSTGEPPGTDSSGTAGGSEVCMEDPMDDACAMCTKMNCCTQLEACVADGDDMMGCNCFQTCVNGGGDPFAECPMMCGVDVASGPTGMLFGCVAGACAAQCA